MYGDVESPTPQLVQKLQRNRSVALRHEIEARAEAQTLLHVGQFEHLVIPGWRIDVVGEHQGELLAAGPAGPVGRRPAGVRVDRPDMGVSPALVLCGLTPQCNLERSRNNRLEGVEDVIGEAVHGFKNGARCRVHGKRNQKTSPPLPFPLCREP